MTLKDCVNTLKLKDLSIYQVSDLTWNDLEKLISDKVSRKDYLSLMSMADERILEIEWKKELETKRRLERAINLYEAKLVSISSTKVNFNLNKLSMAIRDKYYVSVYYQHSNGEYGFRLIEPYVVGRGYAGSEEHRNDYYLRCFVIRDSRDDVNVPFVRNKSVSVSEKVPYWRLMRVDRMHNINIIKRKRRHYREEYTGGTDKNIVNIINSLNVGKLRRVNS
jgi:hypothetical protein